MIEGFRAHLGKLGFGNPTSKKKTLQQKDVGSQFVGGGIKILRGSLFSTGNVV